MSKENSAEQMETAGEEFLNLLEKKLEEMGVAQAYSDSDIKDAMYFMVKDALTDIEMQIHDTENEDVREDTDNGIIIGLQMAMDAIEKHLGVS